MVGQSDVGVKLQIILAYDFRSLWCCDLHTLICADLRDEKIANI